LNSANPYFIGNEDDDILNDAPSSNKGNPQIVGPNGESLPPELAEALSKYINLDDVNVHNSTVPLVVFASADLISFYSELLDNKSDIPIISALCDVVNRISEGLLDNYLELHEARHDIIMIHVVREYSSIIWKAAESAPEELSADKLFLFMGTYHSFLDWKLEEAKSKYIKSCSSLDITPDENIINYGNVTDKVGQKLYRPAVLFSMIKELSAEKENQNGHDSK
jgi:hypothetical protein